MILRIVKRLDGLRSDVFPKGMIPADRETA